MSRWIDADIYVTANLYDDEHEEYRNERITIADCLDRFTDEGCPTEGKPKQQWIPVSERLPDEQEWLGTKMFGTTISDKICITFDDNGKRFVKVMSLQNGELSDSDKKMMDVFHKGWKMLAWMPLPTPYKGGDNE